MANVCSQHSSHMNIALILLLVTVSWACAPTTMQAAPTNAPPSGRRKRAIDEVVVTVASSEDYDEAMNDHHLKVADAMLEDIASSQGVFYNKNDVIQKIKNLDGKFAVQYNIIGADCYANFGGGTVVEWGGFCQEGVLDIEFI
ncbi:hypothetical protein Y032_0150g2732 [Ancylostoma ceylanicum]|uniref:Uncharacterized protein n=2 Tax=Ancylostoma ceylanicum TaxID=53326 RepID=A0A016T100_9BILA|nr:hypothetical protein Y032_0150g2732 [Ancylostoma ceylanicum]